LERWAEGRQLHVARDKRGAEVKDSASAQNLNGVRKRGPALEWTSKGAEPGNESSKNTTGEIFGWRKKSAAEKKGARSSEK